MLKHSVVCALNLFNAFSYVKHVLKPGFCFRRIKLHELKRPVPGSAEKNLVTLSMLRVAPMHETALLKFTYFYAIFNR